MMVWLSPSWEPEIITFSSILLLGCLACSRCPPCTTPFLSTLQILIHKFLFLWTLCIQHILCAPRLNCLSLKSLYPSNTVLQSSKLSCHVCDWSGLIHHPVTAWTWIHPVLFQCWVHLCAGIWDGLSVVLLSRWKCMSLPRCSVPCICSSFPSPCLSGGFDVPLPMVCACISSQKVAELVALAPPCLMGLISPQQSLYLKEGTMVTEAKVLLVTPAAKLQADKHQCVPAFPQVLSFGQRVRKHRHQYPMPSSLIFRALKDLRSLCQHHWCPCGRTEKGHQGPRKPQNALHSIVYLGLRKAANLPKEQFWCLIYGRVTHLRFLHPKL